MPGQVVTEVVAQWFVVFRFVTLPGDLATVGIEVPLRRAGGVLEPNGRRREEGQHRNASKDLHHTS